MKMKTLVILEVSRKQDYIFSSKRLRDNVRRSAEINHVTSEAFFQKAAGKQYHPENMVYSGGGHTILQFESREQAVDFTRQVTEAAIRQYPQMELFAKVMEYQNNCTPGENLKNLSAELERKKSFRKSSIRQLTLGVEAKEQPQPYTEQFFALDALLADSGREIPSEFSELAGEDNFIAVVHIDGNAMGKRVERIYQKVGSDWENCCKTLRRFSEGIQSDFETAFRKMVNILLQKVPLADNQPLPIRPIILAGDDVCFVTAGKIGLEAARVFLEQLSGMQNAEDGGYYAACAGVAMVHIKYPFHRAYQLSEQLCSSAKVFGSGLNADGAVSAIDWHIEFGQLKEGLSDIRADYRTEDGKRLNLRPLFVCGPQECEKRQMFAAMTFSKPCAVHSSRRPARLPEASSNSCAAYSNRGSWKVNIICMTGKFPTCFTTALKRCTTTRKSGIMSIFGYWLRVRKCRRISSERLTMKISVCCLTRLRWQTIVHFGRRDDGERESNLCS